jgi:SSS family solute:Na+ symporter
MYSVTSRTILLKKQAYSPHSYSPLAPFGRWCLVIGHYVVMQLGWLDILVLVVYFTTAVLVGLSGRGKTKSLEAFLLGDRNLPWWAILGSIVATETSGVTVLSVPGHGMGPVAFKFLQIALGYIIGRAIIVYVLLPLYFRGQLLTAYEVLEKRFGGLTQRAASLLFLIARNLGDGLRLFLVAIVLQKLANINLGLSVVVMGVISTIYTFVGGMRSVVWNDCIQFVVYVLGGIAAVFVIASKINGGFAEVMHFAADTGKLQVFDLRWAWTEPYTFWASLIGGAVLTLGTHGTDHSMVQRYLSAKSQGAAGVALLASGFVVLAQFAMFLLIGIELACYFSQHPLPPDVKLKGDEVFAHFIINDYPRNTGLIGLMLAAILASNLSSSLSASAAAVVNDFYLPWQKTPPESGQLVLWTRILTVFFGVLQIALGILAERIAASGSIVVDAALTIAGFVFGLLLGVFALGVLTRRANQTSALVGMAVGLVLLLFLQFGLPELTKTPNLPMGVKIAFPWLAVVGAGTTFLAGWAISWFVPRSVVEGVAS